MLKDLIKQNKLSQLRIANKMKVSQQLVSQWCTGKCEPNIYQLKPLCKILNVDLNTLVECFSNKSEVEA